MDTARSGLVRANVNTFIPKAILIEPCTKVRWSNPSNLPHNVVGVFSQTTGSDSAKSTGKLLKT
jgi:plastocyanin